VLIKEYTSERMSNFKPEKIFYFAKILDFKMMSEHGLEIVNSRKIIACQENVININQYESKRLTVKVFEEKVISLRLGEALNKQNKT